jgi:hypothetical protein
VKRSSRLTSEDLARVLITWCRAGMQVLAVPSDMTTPAPLDLPRLWTSRLAAWWGMVSLGLWKNAHGGFGRRIPLPSERPRMG